MNELLKIVHCETAETLLCELTPHTGSELWKRSDDLTWAFRGQCEAVWDLTPAARRKNAFVPFYPMMTPQAQQSRMSELELAVEEDRLVKRFASFATDAGFELPGDGPWLRDPDEVPLVSESEFPPKRERALYALAQHYRIPTRLLDWTRLPLVAAYFAAEHVAHSDYKKDNASDGNLAVWVVNCTFLIRHCHRWTPAGVALVTAPTVSNPNLHAQKGVFTLVRWRGAGNHSEPLPDLNALFQLQGNIDEALEALKAGDEPLFPMLYKFTLPHDQAPRLMYWLNLHMVNALTVYPGRHSIEPYMMEERLRPVPSWG